jgi:hypothetical protein
MEDTWDDEDVDKQESEDIPSRIPSSESLSEEAQESEESQESEEVGEPDPVRTRKRAAPPLSEEEKKERHENKYPSPSGFSYSLSLSDLCVFPVSPQKKKTEKQNRGSQLQS